jgi:hypothetical protein
MERFMASDEGDRNFDKAIARHLRSVASSADAASSAADPVSRRDSCADAQTLAAYHERSLLPSEMNSWKEHIVACAHCQETLAHLEATDNIPLHAAEEEQVFAGMGSQSAPAAQKLEPQPIAAARAQSARAPRPSSGARWRWLAPAGAIAASLFVWIAIHENQPTVLPSSNEIQVPKKQEPPAPTPPLDTRAPGAESQEQLTLPKSPSLTDEIASANRSVGAESLKRRQSAAYAARPPKPSADKESRLRKDAERDSSADQFLSENKVDLDAKTPHEAPQQRAEVQTQSANVQSQNQSQNQSNASMPKVPGPAPLGQVEASKAMKRMTTPAAPPPAPVAGAAGGIAPSVGTASQTVMVVSDPTWITAPDASAIWRAEHAGLIEFSQDGGHSWSRQPSGVLVDLLTGAATSDKVCWIVGRVGAILLTTDGGAHWKLISSPLKEDLGGIQATDALHATVWNARGTKSYATSDGGLTWERVEK